MSVADQIPSPQGKVAAPKALTEGVKPQLRNVKRVAAAFDGARDSLWVVELLDPLRRLAAILELGEGAFEA